MSTVPRSSDHEILTTACGLVDRSARGKLAFTGAGAAEFLNGQLTNEIVALTPGHGCYAALLTHKGKMVADARVLNTGSELALDTERTALQDLFDTLRRFMIGHDVQLHKRTLERSLLSLIGPRADDVLPARPGADEHDNVAAEIAGTPVLLVRTDVGVDVFAPAERGASVAGALGEAGARAIDEAAAEILRVERGRPRYGVDLDDGVIPQEANLNERAVSFTKGCYVGQETVARLFYKGKPNRGLCGVVLDGAVPEGQELVAADGRVVGRATSVVRSPAHGHIALALVRREAPPGTAVTAGARRARIVELPFAR